MPIKASRFSFWILFLGLAALLNACIPAKKTFYGAGIEPGVKEKIDQSNYGDLQKIQVGDVVQINISSIDPAQSNIFNPFMNGGANAGSSGGQGGRGNGYLVDKAGQVELPIIGNLTVAGLSTRDAREVVRKEVEKYLKNPWVDVAVLSYKVTFLGEVSTQGPISIMNERLSILEGIAQSGGLPPTARYDRVWLIREENGERAYHLLNVNDKSIYQSEFYYLRNNDIIYVEPNKTKQYLAANAPYFNLIGLAAGIAALVLTIFN
jgi:polysaccharide export outer membrane protein